MKGQISIEFVAYLSFMLFISAILMSVMYDKQTKFIQADEEDQARDIASKASYIAEYALTQRNTTFSVKIPLEISSSSYNLTVEEGVTKVRVDGEVFRSFNSYEGRKITLKSGGKYKVINNGSVYFEKQ
ncbi:MAG: hypothetical protein ABEJ99_01705 [Candidatus Nanohaloarchaea archaeon]